MHLLKLRERDGGPVHVGLREGENVRLLSGDSTLSDVLEHDSPADVVRKLSTGAVRKLLDFDWLAPIDRQEVWAAGVTYRRSRTARMEESEHSATCYDRVYTAARPELFFKSTPHRVAGPGQPVRIRRDSAWNVPEPELTLVINSKLKLVGFTIGNDMSSRDIEGENPLYLPQAKVYQGSAALGPGITLAGFMPPPEKTRIGLVVRRGGTEVFSGQTDVSQLHRTFDDLIDYLGRDNSFPSGVLLMTGTGIVPPSDFTLSPGDEISISIDGIGTLTNPVVRSS
ncbi:MAG: fumarylacetoacetate hydrolase family protein [Planctomycetia bacterium]|nr:fumarylacetoacetate hydrolase family protein [Planctomycetia bacterium]